MHQIIMGDPPDSRLTVDHIDRNPLNNNRNNLRWASQTLQSLNQKIRCDNKSGAKGVDYHERYGWRARIQVHKRSIHLGWFTEKCEAIAARKNAEELYHKPVLEGATG